MLINRGVTSGEVVTIKLTSGEELVARLDEENRGLLRVVETNGYYSGPKWTRTLALQCLLLLKTSQSISANQM